MQALAYLAELSPALLPEVKCLIQRRIQSGSPALTSRGRRLLVRLSSLAPVDELDPAWRLGP